MAQFQNCYGTHIYLTQSQSLAVPHGRSRARESSSNQKRGFFLPDMLWTEGQILTNPTASISDIIEDGAVIHVTLQVRVCACLCACAQVVCARAHTRVSSPNPLNQHRTLSLATLFNTTRPLQSRTATHWDKHHPSNPISNPAATHGDG